MSNIIYLAENSLDMFDIEIPQYDTEIEIPSPSASDNYPSEMDTFLNKSFISFGTMAVCIIFLLIIAFIIKKKKNKTDIEEQIERQNFEAIQKEASYEYIPAQTKKQILNTPSSIHKCIKSFLENTKDI